MTLQAAQQSVLLRTMQGEEEEEEEGGGEEEEEVLEIPLPNVERQELERVVQFCEHHVDRCWSECEGWWQTVSEEEPGERVASVAADELQRWWVEERQLPGWSESMRMTEAHRRLREAAGAEAEFGERFPGWYDCVRRALPPDIPKPMEGDAELSRYVSEWDDRFIALPHEQLFELIQAAHYMDIQGLMDLGAAKVATLIKNKTPEEIRQMFHIENDFTPEEEERIREENRWCEDL